ncbi:MAG: glycoside hydrolase family 3 protein [Alphaproteobacteria bacterium]|nr:glycoside hydrolase family 3 protein [Alphaproteobacteria bacterium]
MSKPILPAILSCSGYELTEQEKKLFNQSNPLGINLFSRNIKNKSQLKALISSIYQTIEREDILIAIDQEGGRVRRLSGPEFHDCAAAISIGSLPPQKASKAANLHAQLISYDMHDVNINTNYAPVLDTLHSNTTDALKSRCFSNDTQTIVSLATTEINTYIQNGIIPCIKHLPGHGLATTDPHLGLPIIFNTIKELEKEFIPFMKLNKCPMGMTAHILLPVIDDVLPATQSPKVIKNIIRDLIGFKGLLISDALDMHALKGTIGEKTICSLQAGCDIICYAGGQINDIKQIIDTCPSMSDKSLERFAKLKPILYNTPKINHIDELYSEYCSLLSELPPYQEEYDSTEVLNIMHQQNLTQEA